jgi:hypothetical protein
MHKTRGDNHHKRFPEYLTKDATDKHQQWLLNAACMQPDSYHYSYFEIRYKTCLQGEIQPEVHASDVSR